jgi:hypothetical protein
MGDPRTTTPITRRTSFNVIQTLIANSRATVKAIQNMIVTPQTPTIIQNLIVSPQTRVNKIQNLIVSPQTRVNRIQNLIVRYQIVINAIQNLIVGINGSIRDGSTISTGSTISPPRTAPNRESRRALGTGVRPAI